VPLSVVVSTLKLPDPPAVSPPPCKGQTFHRPAGVVRRPNHIIGDERRAILLGSIKGFAADKLALGRRIQSSRMTVSTLSRAAGGIRIRIPAELCSSSASAAREDGRAHDLRLERRKP